MNDCQSPAELGTHESDGGPIQSSHRPSDELAFPVEPYIAEFVYHIPGSNKAKQKTLTRMEKDKYMGVEIG